jgi:hypothetical protein
VAWYNIDSRIDRASDDLKALVSVLMRWAKSACRAPDSRCSAANAISPA